MRINPRKCLVINQRLGFKLFIFKYIKEYRDELGTQKEMGLRSANPLSKNENEIEK